MIQVIGYQWVCIVFVLENVFRAYMIDWLTGDAAFVATAAVSALPVSIIVQQQMQGYKKQNIMNQVLSTYIIIVFSLDPSLIKVNRPLILPYFKMLYIMVAIKI